MARRRAIRPSRILMFLILFVVAVIYLFPITWIVVSSFKPLGEVQREVVPGYARLEPGYVSVAQDLFVFTPTLDAYFRVVFTASFVKFLTNSLIVSSATLVLSLVIGVPAAYTLSRAKNRFTRNLAAWIISTRMAPQFALILPFFLIFSNPAFRPIGGTDSVFALIIVYLTFNLSFVIWTLMGYFEEIPKDLERAAMTDGLSRIQAIIKIILPVSKPGIVAVSIIAFLLSWNEFFFAFTLTSINARTLPVEIASLVGFVVLDFPAMTAISAILMAPSFIFIIFAQKYILKGLTMGAIR